MGGHVKLVIRSEDGNIHSGITHTNSLCYNFMNKNFLTGASVKQGILDNINWQNENSVHCSLVAPLEYGIVLFDFMTKTIIDSQDYTSLNRALVYNEVTEIKTIMSFLGKRTVDKEIIDIIKLEKYEKTDIAHTLKMFEDGSYTGFTLHNRINPREKIRKNNMSFSETIEYAIKHESTRSNYETGDTSIQDFIINLCGFDYLSRSIETAKDSLDVMNLFEAIGIKTDRDSWKEFSKSYED